MEMEMEVEWGTWEELILVSSVLRHGTCDWDAVVVELRSRTFAPLRFTAEVCKEKYECLQQHFSTCSDLLEGLRKQRIVELKRTLEKSNGSIGYLQTKLQTLKAEKEHSSSVDYQSSPFRSPAQTSVGQSSGKATSKDGLSAGSITQEIIKIHSPQIHSPQIHSPVIITPLQPSASLWITDDLETTIQMEWGIGVKKKRGKRKRRGQRQDIKEDNFDDPSLSFLSRIKVEPTSECDLASPSHNTNKFRQATDGLKCSELTRIFDMISNNEHALIFRRRLDSQKRARYRMMVRQHMDLDAIKCRIDKQTITSTKELYRDFLLLATNAAIFYSRNTREHKYAVLLQGVIKQLITESKKSSIDSEAPANVPQILPPKITSKKPKIFEAVNQKSLEKSKTDESVTKAVSRASKTSKPKASHPAKNCSQSRKIKHQARDANALSRKHPQSQAKLASVNSLNTKDGSFHQPLLKLTSTNVLSSMDGSKERKRARKL